MMRPRPAVDLGIVLGIALIHVFRLGSHLSGVPRRLYYSYFSDVVLPIAAYFLLCRAAARHRFLKDRWVKAAFVFGAASFAEILQGFGVPLLGRTFDPLDFVSYAAGALIAMIVDTVLTGLLRMRPA